MSKSPEHTQKWLCFKNKWAVQLCEQKHPVKKESTAESPAGAMLQYGSRVFSKGHHRGRSDFAQQQNVQVRAVSRRQGSCGLAHHTSIGCEGWHSRHQLLAPLHTRSRVI